MEMMNEVKKFMLASAIATVAVGVTTQASAEELKPTEPISGSQQKTATQKTVTETDVAIFCWLPEFGSKGFTSSAEA